MSINHISLWPNTPQFYHHHHHNPPPETTTTAATMFGFNLNNMSDEEIEEQIERNDSKPEPEGGGGEGGEMLKEHLFEKPLTPSDVGKLNRLVIPKQHAEKYFPLTGNNSNSNSNSNSNNNNDSGGAEKGLLLSFEDELGKSWRFRYSYWNSSQSYVLTKGWSRFVKEKRLDAGDIVLFERHRMDGDRLFIGWRRRNASTGSGSASAAIQENKYTAVAVAPPGGWGQVYYGGHTYPGGAGLPYQPDCLHAGRGVTQNQTTASANNTRRQVRLFGVNLECEADESLPPTPDGGGDSSTSINHHHHHHRHGSGQGQASQHYYQYQFDQYSKAHVTVPPSAANNNHHNHMDVNFSRDVNQMRYHQG